MHDTPTPRLQYAYDEQPVWVFDARSKTWVEGIVHIAMGNTVRVVAELEGIDEWFDITECCERTP